METGMETLNYKLHLTRDYGNSGITNHFIYCLIIISTLHLLDYLMYYYFTLQTWIMEIPTLPSQTRFLVQKYSVAIFKSLPLPLPVQILLTWKDVWLYQKMDWQNVNTKIINMEFPFTLISNPRMIQIDNVYGWAGSNPIHEIS